MGVVLRIHPSSFILTFFICVLVVFFERQETTSADGTVCSSLCDACAAGCEPCNECGSWNIDQDTVCTTCSCPRKSEQRQRVAGQCGSYVRNRIAGNSMQIEPRPNQGLVTAFIYQCMSFIMCLAVLLVLSTLDVKSHTTWKMEGSSQEENPPLVERKEPIIEDQTGTNDFLRDVASLYQEAVREVDFARVGRRVGLDDYQIQEIINNQAEQLRGEAKLKYQDWNSSKSPQSRDDLRDDIVAERIKLLPDILVQYKRPQGRAAYAG
ncbi:hypothetical protein Bbelb_338390 [Branchiostoma belcheri]|nr:hypothetical protein Bbelb_338390 [Branchiostoma belcheri]